MTATRNSPRYPSLAVCSSYDKYYDNLTKIYFSARWLVGADTRIPGRILVSRLKSSRDSGFSSKIGTIPPKSGRLDMLHGF